MRYLLSLLMLAGLFSSADAKRPSMAEIRTQFAEELKLTDAQQRSIRDLMRGVRGEAMRGQADVRVQMRELRDGLADGTLSEPDASKRLAQISDAHRTLAQKRLDAFFAFKKLLTPEQVATLNRLSLDHPELMSAVLGMRMDHKGRR